MLRCSPEAFAKCPTRALCGNVQEATFTEGSECDQFNRSVLDQPVTYADKIRMLSDEQLVSAIWALVQLGDVSGLYCPQTQKCIDIIAAEGNVPEEWCRECLMEWLKQETLT